MWCFGRCRRPGWGSGCHAGLGGEDPVPVPPSPVAKSCATWVTMPLRNEVLWYTRCLCIFMKWVAGAVLGTAAARPGTTASGTTMHLILPESRRWLVPHFPPENHSGSFQSVQVSGPVSSLRATHCKAAPSHCQQLRSRPHLGLAQQVRDERAGAQERGGGGALTARKARGRPGRGAQRGPRPRSERAGGAENAGRRAPGVARRPTELSAGLRASPRAPQAGAVQRGRPASVSPRLRPRRLTWGGSRRGGRGGAASGPRCRAACWAASRSRRAASCSTKGGGGGCAFVTCSRTRRSCSGPSGATRVALLLGPGTTWPPPPPPPSSLPSSSGSASAMTAEAGTRTGVVQRPRLNCASSGKGATTDAPQANTPQKATTPDGAARGGGI